MIGGQPGGRLLTKRGLISTAAGIVLSLPGLALAKLRHGDTWWSDILILTGFFVAAFTPFFGVHSDNPGSIDLFDAWCERFFLWAALHTGVIRSPE